MKILKALKITSILQIIFCFCCILFSVCLIADAWGQIKLPFFLFAAAGLGWMVNPTPFLSFIVCLALFLGERNAPGARQLIGRKSLWIFLWPIIDIIFYLTAVGFLVEATGGV